MWISPWPSVSCTAFWPIMKNRAVSSTSPKSPKRSGRKSGHHRFRARRLTAAYYLLQQGYSVTIFEKLPEPGGMMRYGIPEYRLPRDILADEIDVIRQMGAEIKCGVAFGSDITLESLKADGYSLCFMAIGLHGGRNLGVENEDAEGVLQGVDFLRDAAMGKDVDLGDDVIVVGGGNVAIDVALTAKRKGAKNVTLICLEKREEMPAWEHEIEEALEGDINIVNSFGPKSFYIDKNKVSGIEFKTCTAVFDETAASTPQYDEAECQPFSATRSLSPSARAPTWRASRSRASPSHGPAAWKPIR
jgi:NADPH-dependent glutamate synthase beta subunit-like oxidoreductase